MIPSAQHPTTINKGYLKWLINTLPKIFDFRLSPQGDAFWQETLIRLDIYHKDFCNEYELSYLKSLPTEMRVPNHTTLGITRAFVKTIDPRLSREAGVFLWGGLGFGSTYESSPFWFSRYNALNTFGRMGEAKFFRDYAIPSASQALDGAPL